MDKHDYDPVLDSRYSCQKCEDSGIDIETREYCECRKGLERCNSDKFADMLQGAPYKEAMFTMSQATMKSERAIAAADLALLKHRIAGLERELAEARKDAERYRFLRTRDITFEGEEGSEFVCYAPELGHDGSNLDAAIDAASVAQANKEQGNG